MRFLSSSLATLATVLSITGSGPLPHFRITLSDSLPRGVYLVTHGMIYRGTIVAECLPLELAILGKERGYIGHGNCPGDVSSIMKQVAGLPGDTVELAEEYVAINGALVPGTPTQKEDSKGRVMPSVARGAFVLKHDEVFLLALNSWKSWDGRYMGAAKISSLVETLKPIWTEKGN